ncbi:MAG: hypothetical protein ACI9JZ_000938 [Lentimonas sp.]|jgi:hypothetical protein
MASRVLDGTSRAQLRRVGSVGLILHSSRFRTASMHRERLLAPNAWLAEQFQMGIPNSASRRVSRCRGESGSSDDE